MPKATIGATSRWKAARRSHIEPLRETVHALLCLTSIRAKPVDVMRNMLQIHRDMIEAMGNGAMNERVEHARRRR